MYPHKDNANLIMKIYIIKAGVSLCHRWYDKPQQSKKENKHSKKTIQHKNV